MTLRDTILDLHPVISVFYCPPSFKTMPLTRPGFAPLPHLAYKATPSLTIGIPSWRMPIGPTWRVRGLGWLSGNSFFSQLVSAHENLALSIVCFGPQAYYLGRSNIQHCSGRNLHSVRRTSHNAGGTLPRSQTSRSRPQFVAHLASCSRIHTLHQDQTRTTSQVITLLGPQATGLANAEYDLTVVSLANKDARATYLPNQDSDPSRLANKYLDSVADHKLRHRPRSNLAFHPIVFSLGGMMNGSTTKVFASWKRVMTRGTYNLMLKRLSLCLLQARVRSFEL
jgi:hypothetical protein